ncbi:hypothetical protein [Fulvivirga sediminis]|uniref:Uncharacterized protein n=1 Tax=Fulvivirga sediminis TaxID=2803949 RepID=A0A937F8M5_9BACT|nr:hypothetical protein [Fulvivirga sediminis]MBL3658341.1 hypothetical protein [Fulvivirga sediminis]
MRLMQLARQLGTSQQEIVDFLITHNIQIELHGNSKMPEEYLPLIYEHWTPAAEESLTPAAEKEEELLAETEANSYEETLHEASIPEDNSHETETIQEPVVTQHTTPTPPINTVDDPETEAEKPGVTIIRAKKVKLEGIKVLGKIDLPEPKPKKEETPSEKKVNQERERSNRKPYKDYNRKGKRRKQPESYEQKQKRQEREELKKKRVKEKKLKEKKKKYYEENIKVKQAQSSSKKKTTKTAEQTHKKKKSVERHPNPLKRFWAWLNGKYDQ